MSANQKSEPRALTERGAATRSRIVNAAADLMYEHGMEGTSLDEVMAASGVSKSQLYHYFTDQDVLGRGSTRSACCSGRPRPRCPAASSGGAGLAACDQGVARRHRPAQ